MGIPLMIQEKDNERIEMLKKDFGILKKIEVIRVALTLMEKEAQHMKRVKRWKNAAKLVAESSQEINKAFQKHSRMKSE